MKSNHKKLLPYRHSLAGTLLASREGLFARLATLPAPSEEYRAGTPLIAHPAAEVISQ